MLDKNAIERALLLGVVKEQNWNILILNNITIEYFSFANQPMYKYIKDYLDTNKSYPELPILCYTFDIDDITFRDYMEITDLPSLCDVLKNEFIRVNVVKETGKLNEHSNELKDNPLSYIQRLGDVYDSLKTLTYSHKSVGLLDNIEEAMQIDPSDVISTGFPELDEILVGWKRGEELVVFVGRTGQGKSWMGLKFALDAALHNETVGLYSGEMSLQRLQERILCCAKQSYTSTKEDALNFLKNNNVDIRILTPKELKRRATADDLEELIVRDNLSMLVVDQLSLMEDKNRGFNNNIPLRQRYDNISNDLYDLSIKYSIPIILLVQSNRAGAQEQEGPGVDNIAESDAVGQNATRVISMKNENGVLTLRVAKNRYGDTGSVIKYEVDFGINKYAHIKENRQEISSLKAAKARQMFGLNKSVF